MKRFHEIAKIVYQNLEETCPGFQKQEAYLHLYGVATICIQFAKLQHLDSEIAATIGILHDYASYYLANNFDHANRSSMLAKDILTNSNVFTTKEIDIICNAIKNHSNKHNIDDVYSELIKDSDTWYIYLYEQDTIFNPFQLQRIEKIKKAASF